jgi:hypothetical protein
MSLATTEWRVPSRHTQTFCEAAAPLSNANAKNRLDLALSFDEKSRSLNRPLPARG